MSLSVGEGAGGGEGCHQREQSGGQGKSHGCSLLCAMAGNSCRVGSGLQPEKGELVCWIQSFETTAVGIRSHRMT